jgi:small subunit ribosomal protein S9
MTIKKTTTATKTVKKKVAATKVAKVKAVKEVKKVAAVKEVKKEVKKVAAKKTEAVSVAEFSGKYFYAVGKRKTSIAQVRIYATDKEESNVVVNGKEVTKYFTIERHVEAVKAPMVAAGLADKFDISVKVVGGGVMGQAEATRLGVARALVVYDENLKKTLKDVGFLTRDARIVERKKPGKRKARRSPQWAKR